MSKLTIFHETFTSKEVKDKDRGSLAKDIEAFLAKGNKIESVKGFTPAKVKGKASVSGYYGVS